LRVEPLVGTLICCVEGRPYTRGICIRKAHGI
jgi:hypothetical protein